ncbi:MAG TPA: ribonuclease J [Bryobacteraceae bacterium]|nr:ribonuclease J [Bryobacterales bacterium]HRJ17753.1 ribonuclease J [Bryobacteraceae bacterium]
MPDKKLQVIPLGGLGEFGMNCMALRYGDDIMVIDSGMMFPDAELLGVDVVIPDFSYLEDNREHVRGLVLTHGHEDHIGSVPFFLAEFNVPVYGTRFTLSLVERRLSEHSVAKPRLNAVKPGEKVELGPFSVEFIHVTHSTASCVALAITTPLGVIIHTGDFKIDPTPTDNIPFDLHSFAEYGKRGVLLLMSDSTNVDRSGYTPSERSVVPRFEEIFNRAERRIVFTIFSSSVHRMQQILDVASEYGRKVAFIGRSMTSVSEIAHSQGLLQIPDGILLRPQDIMQANPAKTVVVVAGTQGEPMSAMSRIAVDSHKHLSLDKGDLVVHSARNIPGNEKAIGRMMNHIARRGAEVVAGGMTPPIHVSGHGAQEELKLMLNLVRPRYFVPLHGEFWQMSKHAALASHLRGTGLEETFILETGQSLEIDRHGARRGQKITVGRVCIDSGSVDEVVEDIVIRDRRHLSEDGFVIPIIAIDKNTGRSEGSPELVSRGFVSMEDRDILTKAREVVAKTLESSSKEERTDWGVMQEKIRAELKRYLNKQTSRRPLIMPVILEV